MHQYTSPPLQKTKSIGSLAAASTNTAALLAGGMPHPIVPYDRSKLTGPTKNERRKHASPNQRYQNVPTESDLELLAENSAVSNLEKAREHGG